MEELLKELDENLEIIETIYNEDIIEIHIKYTGKISCCPKCGTESVRRHSNHTSYAWDLPIQNYKVKLVMHVNEYFCDNDDCSQKIFAEKFEFLGSTRKRTKRLEEYILNLSKSSNALQAERFMNDNVSKISNDTILRLVKKNSENQL